MPSNIPVYNLPLQTLSICTTLLNIYVCKMCCFFVIHDFNSIFSFVSGKSASIFLVVYSMGLFRVSHKLCY